MAEETSDTRQSLADLAALTGAPAPVVAEVVVHASENADDFVAAPVSNEPVREPMPLREAIIDAQGRAYATGRRKDAVARVWIKPGTGKIVVNGRDQEIYFARPTLRLVISQAFEVADRVGGYDVICTVKEIGRAHV